MMIEAGDIFDDFAIERTAKEGFGVDIDIDTVIARNIDASRGAIATVFLSKKKQLYCYLDGPAKLVLADVKKIASRMGLEVEMFVPPKGKPTYFDDIGRERFRAVFPGRAQITDKDIVYYRTLAPYRPALFLVREIKDGVIYCADSDARSGWRPAARFAYRRIRTSS